MSPYERINDAIGSLPNAGELGWDRLTDTQQRFVAMGVVEGQVTNGGFHAVYYNSCHEYLALAASGYQAIGAREQATIVQNVLTMMASDPWAGPPNTWPDPDAAEPPPGTKDIGEFDDQWYALDLNALDLLKARYIEDHPAEFVASAAG